MNITQIKPYQRNAKKHPEKQIKLIAESIKRFGFDSPIIIDKNNEVIAGHGRLEAAKMLGLTDVPVILKENLTEEEVRAYRLADNKIAESEWDMGLAIEELKGLSDDLFDLTGFDKDLLIEPDENDDVIPENVPAVSKLGDLYELGSHRVLCGDSTKIEDVEKLMDGKKADMVFTDPPYGVEYEGGMKEWEQIKNDGKKGLDIFLTDVLTNVQKVTKEGGAWYVWHGGLRAKDVYQAFDNIGEDKRTQIIWNKNRLAAGWGDFRYKHECAVYKKGQFYGGRAETTVWDIAIDREYKHPTQKPVALCEKGVILSSKQDDIVLDLFGGSGSTLIACEKTNRICYGMELDEHYVDTIVQRYVDYTKNEEVIKNGVKTIWKQTEKAK